MADRKRVVATVIASTLFALALSACVPDGSTPPVTTTRAPVTTTVAPPTTTKPPVTTTKPPVTTTKPPVTTTLPGTTTTTKPPVTTTKPPVTTTKPPVTTTTQPPPGPCGALFYTCASSWNTPLGAATFHDKPALRSGAWWVNYEQYANPIYFASNSDPLVTVHATGSWGWPSATLNIHVPAGALPSAGSDASLTIVNGSIAYDFWIFQWNNGTHTDASSTAYAESNIVTDSGWGSSSPWLGAGIHGSGSALIAGEIYGNELQSSTGIHHAIAVSGTGGMFCAEAPGGYIAPAIGGDGACEGPRLGIPPGVAMPAGLSVPGQSVWHALQTYGGFAIDTNGCCAPVVMAVDPNTVSFADTNALRGDLGTINQYVRMVN